MLAWTAAIVIASFSLACARVSAKAQVTEPYDKDEVRVHAGLSIVLGLLALATARYL